MNQPQRSVTLDQTEAILCENCGHDVFSEGTYLRKVSRFLTGSDKDSLIPSPTFYCAKCLHVNAGFNINNLATTHQEAEEV